MLREAFAATILSVHLPPLLFCLNKISIYILYRNLPLSQ